MTRMVPIAVALAPNLLGVLGNRGHHTLAVPSLLVGYCVPVLCPPVPERKKREEESGLAEGVFKQTRERTDFQR